MAKYNKKNLANGTLSAGINTSVTSLTLQSGEGALQPTTPFYGTLTPYGVLSTPSNSEIVQVTAISTDTLTIVRAQRGSTAQSFLTGDIFANSIYSEDIDDLTQDDIPDGTTYKQYSSTEKTKLAGIATGADVTGSNNAATATKWAATKTVRTNLASTSTAALDGSANITPGVTGTLPVANGGTGTTTHTSGNYLKGAGTGAVTSESAATLAATVGALLFPIGALYTSTVSTNPGTLLGFGTWSAYAAGQVLVGKAASGTFATAGATGGEETHVLTSTEMPAHNHPIRWNTSSDDNDNGSDQSFSLNAGATANVYAMSWSANTGGAGRMVSRNTGGGGAHNNLQPYVVVYIWQRTA